MTPHIDFWINLVTTAFEKFPKFEGRTYRNLRFTEEDKFRAFRDEYSSGKDVILTAFSSSSKDPNGYIVSDNYVVHLIIDGVSGSDISDTFSTPEQREVVYLPGTVLHIDSVGAANDGNPIIYAREVITNGKDLGADRDGVRESTSATDHTGSKGYAERIGHDVGTIHDNRGLLEDGTPVGGGEIHSAQLRSPEEVNTAQSPQRVIDVWDASINQVYQAGLSDLPESGVPTGASPAQRSAYEAGRAESIRRLEQELDSVSPAQAHYFGSESGLVRDEFWKRAYLSSRDSRRMDALGKVLGVKIRFTETVADGRANAKYENGVITLALDARDPVMTSVIHESVHRIREISPESYDALSRFIQDNMSSEKLDSALKDRSRLYQTTDNAVLTEEVVADAFGVMLKDSAVLDQLVKDNRAAAEKALDVVRDIINSIRRTLHQRNLNLTRNQKSAFRDLESRLTEMEGNFSDALKKSEIRKNTAVESGEAKFSIVKNKSGQLRVIIDRDIFKNVPPDRRIDVLKSFLMDTLRGNQYKTLKDGEIIAVEQKNKKLQKLWRPGVSMNDKKFDARLEAVSHLDELIQASVRGGIESNKKPETRPDRENVEKRNVIIEIPSWDKNGRMVSSSAWDVELSIPKSKSTGEKTAYDISRLEKRMKDTHSDRVLLQMQKQMQKAAIDRASFEKFISQNAKVVKK